MDKNLISYASLRPLGERMHANIDIIPPDGSYADTLKITDCDHGKFVVHKIVGGTEDCCDLNNKCSNISVWADEWYSGGKYVCTIKGGSSDITVGGVIHRHGSEMDVDIGNRSDQSDNPTRRVTLNFTTSDGSKVRVRVLNGERPRLANAESNYQFVLVLGPTVGSLWQKVFNQLVKLFGRR